jgi:hypothetical protein
VRGPGPFTTCMDRLDEVNLTHVQAGRRGDRRTVSNRDWSAGRIVEGAGEGVDCDGSSMGRGVSRALDVLGLDHRAARADLDEAASA